MSVYLTTNYDHIPLPIVMEFLINVIGTKMEQRMSKYVFFFFRFKNGGHLVGPFNALTVSHEIWILWMSLF